MVNPIGPCQNALNGVIPRESTLYILQLSIVSQQMKMLWPGVDHFSFQLPLVPWIYIYL